MFEQEAVLQQEFEGKTEEAGPQSYAEDGGGSGTMGEDYNPFAPPNTEALPAPERPSDAHRVSITAVTKFVSANTGSTAINVALQSTDTGTEMRKSIWLPLGYVENINVDPNTLPEGEEVLGEDGRMHEKGNQRKQYARSIHNSKDSAELDKLLSYAKAAGKDFRGVGRPSDFDGVIEGLNTLLSGVEFIVTRVPQRNNPEFLEVNAMYPIDSAGEAKFVAGLEKRGYKVSWNQ